MHIDFGDCFEVAMKRDKFPEKIPFRLTRMLIKAMEVSGIEGNFRTTCENTMNVMREGKDSLLALLEAFVYDPLISFKLLIPNMAKQKRAEGLQGEKSKTVGPAKPKDEEEKRMQQLRRATTTAVPREETKDLRRGTIRQSIVETVLAMYNEKTVIEESKYSKKVEDKELTFLMGPEGTQAPQDQLNETAEMVIKRISSKLRGTDFSDKVIGVEL